MADIISADKYKKLAEVVHELDIDKLPEEAQRKIFEQLLMDRAKAQLQNKIDKATFNLEDRINTWITDTTTSEYTKRSYLKAVNDFLEYISKRNVHPLDVNYEIAVQYRNSLKERYAYRSVLSKIAYISSLYNHLVNLEDIQRNPFKGMKRLKMKVEDRSAYVPSALEVEELITSFLNDLEATGKGSHMKRKAAVPSAIAVALMAYRGLRIGIFNSLIIKEGGAFSGISKGKPISGNVNDAEDIFDDVYSRLRKIGFKPNKPFPASTTLKVNIENRIEKLWKRNYFSCHSLRHYFSITFYQQTKDLYRLKELLEHSSIQT
ncbi:hypothetical protein GF340_03895, partial [Candidatus Peregrinibacteria bacterium]|nr:hypothetical protein [Candidatus Peregrinibacteria bacterium]